MVSEGAQKRSAAQAPRSERDLGDPIAPRRAPGEAVMEGATSAGARPREAPAHRPPPQRSRRTWCSPRQSARCVDEASVDDPAIPWSLDPPAAPAHPKCVRDIPVSRIVPGTPSLWNEGQPVLSAELPRRARRHAALFSVHLMIWLRDTERGGGAICDVPSSRTALAGVPGRGPGPANSTLNGGSTNGAGHERGHRR